MMRKHRWKTFQFGKSRSLLLVTGGKAKNVHWSHVTDSHPSTNTYKIHTHNEIANNTRYYTDV